ncbi:MAG: hypothetical protein ACJAVK_002475 [Akkermansiaceae bacterium]
MSGSKWKWFRNDSLLSFKRASLKELFVDESEYQCSAYGTHGVGEPVSGVIAGPVFEEGLMEFVPNSDERKGDGDINDELTPSGFLREKEGCGKKSAAAKKVSKVDDFVEMRDIKNEGSRRMELVAMGKEVQQDEPQQEAEAPKA